MALVVASPACSKTVEAFLQALQAVDISLPPSFAPQTDSSSSSALKAPHLAVADTALPNLNLEQLDLQGNEQSKLLQEQLTGQAGLADDVQNKGKLQGLRCKPEQVAKAMGGIAGRTNGFS